MNVEDLVLEARDSGLETLARRVVREYTRAEHLLAEKRALDIEVAELRVLASTEDGDAPSRFAFDEFSAAGAITDALTSAYGRNLDEGRVLRKVAGGMAGRIVLWLDRAGYQIVDRDTKG